MIQPLYVTYYQVLQMQHLIICHVQRDETTTGALRRQVTGERGTLLTVFHIHSAGANAGKGPASA